VPSPVTFPLASWTTGTPLTLIRQLASFGVELVVVLPTVCEVRSLALSYRGVVSSRGEAELIANMSGTPCG
jgi:hypothetical protein